MIKNKVKLETKLFKDLELKDLGTSEIIELIKYKSAMYITTGNERIHNEISKAWIQYGNIRKPMFKYEAVREY